MDDVLYTDLIAARDAALLAREEGRVLVLPEGCSLHEARVLYRAFTEAGGGNVDLSDLTKEVMIWFLSGCPDDSET